MFDWVRNAKGEYGRMDGTDIWGTGILVRVIHENGGWHYERWPDAVPEDQYPDGKL